MRFIELIDLASERLGGKALGANDEFFAPKENLLKSGRGVFIEDKYTSRGKWMDGWETRRRRTPGFDWCVVKLGLRGIIRGVDIDTNHFTGNFPSHASLEARDGAGPWVEVLAKVELKGSTQNLFNVSDTRPWTHVRLNIFPDGGVARLRVHGDAVPDWERLRLKKGSVDLASVENGGLAILASDMFYSHATTCHAGRSKNMGVGKQRPARAGHGCHHPPDMPLHLQVELTPTTSGELPRLLSAEGCAVEHGETLESLASATWTTLLPQTKLKAHTRHYFDKELVSKEVFTHIRLNIYPDGGVSRLRLHGQAR